MDVKSKRSFCPICNSESVKLVCVDVAHLHKCNDCRIVFNSEFSPLKYDEQYFVYDYKDLYGKTYIEDIENIYSLSVRRLNTILNIWETIVKWRSRSNIQNFSLLDIGSAMGFFLKAARDLGIGEVRGVEVSSFAAEYSNKEYKFDIINAPFEDIDLKSSFDFITAWYFIEHTEYPAINIKKIYNHLNSNGIFAFSVPSVFGPQYSFHRSEWAESIPVDHRIYFSPFTIKRLLKGIGFKKIITKPGGIHPERVLSMDTLFYKLISKIYKKVSEMINFSDTLEVFAIK